MSIKWCNDCWVHHWEGEECFPEYTYFMPRFDDEDEWRKIRANGFEEAATKACEQFDSGGDYPIISNGGLDEIRVKDKFGAEKIFHIEAESLPHYYAKEIATEQEQDA